jgi:hypothetical protein
MGDNWTALAYLAAFLLAGFWLTDRLGRAAVRRTFYYGVISFIVGVLLSKSMRKTIFDGIAGLRDIVENETATH